ncbi:hypothetical protein VitviT2T_016274 [Vitis vinifera]|uniref:Pentatricopeptide repeat-containing protein n=3 Tax=Vitis vinifera TaxID=29760 RepID=A0ABY9CQE7_VITVI|nr:hypothetical protein VitviT2T_016274 [Vitis vinifera]
MGQKPKNQKIRAQKYNKRRSLTEGWENPSAFIDADADPRHETLHLDRSSAHSAYGFFYISFVHATALSMKKQSENRGANNISLCLLCAHQTQPCDGVALQMTLLLFITRPSRVRASKIAIAQFHEHAVGISRNRPEVIQNPENWIVKVICTLCVRTHSLDACLDYFSKTLTPSIAFEVVRGLNNPELALKFFQLSRVNLNLCHSFRTYSFLLRSLSEMGFHESAKAVYDCMNIDGHSPDASVLGFLVSSATDAGKFNIARTWVDGVEFSLVVYNKLLNQLVRGNQVDEAVCFFREQMGLHGPFDSCSFNILIRGLCRIGKVDKAFELFNEMRGFGCSPDVITYNTLINGFCRVNEVDRGHDLLKELLSKNDLSPDVVTYTSIISGYCKLGKMEKASILFNNMISSGIKPNAFTFNILINGFGKVGDMVSAENMYEEMLLLGCPPDIITFTSLIDGHCRTGKVERSLKLWHELNARNLSPNEYTFAILTNALCKENRLHEARGFLRDLKWRHIVAQPFMYNPVIDGFCKAGNVDEANVILAEMEEKRCKPDKITYTILIIGHCMKGRLSEAISIFNRMLGTGCAPDSITMTSLISCLLKAGMPNEAYRIMQIASEDFNLGLKSLKRNVPLRTNTDIPVAV